MARSRRNTLFFCPTRTGVEDDCQIATGGKEVGIQIFKHDRKLGSEKVVQMWQSVIRHLSQSSESRDRGRMLGSTVDESEESKRMWKSKTAWAPCLLCIRTISKCKVLLRCAMCSVTSYGNIDNADQHPEKIRHSSTSLPVRAPADRCNLFRTS